MKISYQYLTTDELDVSIKDIFDYIKFLHTDSDMSIKSPLSYVEEWELNKEEIIQAFKDVENAKQGADTAKNNALKYQNEQIPSADAKADKTNADR